MSRNLVSKSLFTIPKYSVSFLQSRLVSGSALALQPADSDGQSVIDTSQKAKEAGAFLQRDQETNQALALLKAQNKLYAIAEIRHKPFYFSLNDVIVAPRIKELGIGDVIELDRVRELGSENYVLQGNPYVHPSYFSIKATVIEHPYSEPNVTERKKKAGKTVKIHRTGHTLLRVSEISIL